MLLRRQKNTFGTRASALMGVLLLALVPAQVLSQSKLMKEADALYFQKRYGEAYALYSQVKTKKADKELSLKKAECNYYVENYPVAYKFYSEYFTDTLYHPTQQYQNYATSARYAGKIETAVNLYRRILANGADEKASAFLESSKLYLDSANKIRVFNLDSSYTCVELDATDSHDSLAAPMTYVWDFKDGSFGEGIKVTHCFKQSGLQRITLSIRDKATGYVKLNDTAVVVYIESPPVKFDFPKRPRQYMYYTLDASRLEIEGHDILEYIWDLGEGMMALEKKTRRKFDKLDTYTVKLTVVAKNRITGQKVLMASSRTVEVVDNYADHSQTFKDTLEKGEK